MPKKGYKQLSIALRPEDAGITKKVAQAAKKRGQSRSQWMLGHIKKALGKDGR